MLEQGIADGRTVTVLSHQVLYCQPGAGDHDDAQVLEVNTTGASAGIGAAVAYSLVEAGTRVAPASLNASSP